MPGVDGSWDNYPENSKITKEPKTVRETPDSVIVKMIDMADFETLEVNYPYFYPHFLEPSAGEGKIADFVLGYGFERERIHCVELNEEKCRTLQAKGYPTTRADFMTWVPKFEYDLIIAAPPFIGNADVNHILRMYAVLKPGCHLVSLTSPFWMTNNETHQVAFREFLKGKEHEMYMLPDNTFMEKGKTVPTAIIKISKSYRTD